MDLTAQRVDDSADAEPEGLFGGSATVAGCVGFVLLGALNAFYGPAIPALRSRFGLAPASAGLALSMFYVGAVAGVLLAGVLHRRTRNSRLLIVACLVMAAGALGFALSGVWLFALTSSLVLGLGAGGIDYGLNTLFSVGFGSRSPAMLGVLNAHFGLGAVLGPLAISLVGAANYPVAFAVSAAALVAVSFFMRRVRTTSPAADASTSSASTRTFGATLVLVAAFLALYALQVGVETGVGAWEPTYLQASLGRGAVYAANATSVFWLALTAGRLLVAPLTSRLSAPVIVTVSCLGTTGCLALASIHPLAPIAFAGAGLFNAPVFPVALPWLNRAAPTVRWAGTGAILTANLGGIAAGPLTGLGIERFGSGCVPWLLTAVSALCLLLALQLTRSTAARGSAAIPEPAAP